jgi:hypothetical protein
MGGYVSTDRTPPQPGTVLHALQNLLADPGLKLSERNRRFLEFVVTETIRGHADRIKAYTIGVDVFGRDQDFDPTVDPIVRIEANRVRSALARFYDTEGRNEPLRILIPPGSYVPSFKLVVDQDRGDEDDAAAASAGAAGRRIVVRERTGKAGAATSRWSELFMGSFIAALARRGQEVFWVPPEYDVTASRSVGDRLAAERCVDLAVHELGAKRRYSWRAWEAKTGAILLCAHQDLEARSTSCFELIDDIAGRAAEDIARLPVNPHS